MDIFPVVGIMRLKLNKLRLVVICTGLHALPLSRSPSAASVQTHVLSHYVPTQSHAACMLDFTLHWFGRIKAPFILI